VRELLQRGIADGSSYLYAVPDGGFIVFPLYRYFKVAGRLRLIGSIAEMIRTSWRVLWSRVQRPEVRHVRTVSKRTYAGACRRRLLT